ncbi:hypothetical protein ACP6PL_22300, partial [Dapis sp. BLCC M126]|uniref:hypothetical protein n=1 Tax=Dapis sp. BLCC M126 TaxID=3400189 RepID=UPI003CEC0BE7
LTRGNYQLSIINYQLMNTMFFCDYLMSDTANATLRERHPQTRSFAYSFGSKSLLEYFRSYRNIVV